MKGKKVNDLVGEIFFDASNFGSLAELIDPLA